VFEGTTVELGLEEVSERFFAIEEKAARRRLVGLVMKSPSEAKNVCGLDKSVGTETFVLVHFLPDD